MSADGPFSAAELVKGLTDEQKEAVLMVIVEEVLALYPNSGSIPLHTAGGELIAFIQTLAGAQAVFDKHGPKLTPEERAEISERAKNLGQSITFEEMYARLGWGGKEQAQTPPLRATG